MQCNEDRSIFFGVVAAAYPLSTTVCSLLLPLLTARLRLSVGGALCVCLAATVAGMAPYGFVRSSWALVCLRLVTGGTSAGMIFVRRNIFQLAGDNVARQRRYSAGMTASMGLGYALGPAVAASLGKAQDQMTLLSPNATLGLVMAALALVLGVASAAVLRDTPTKAKPSPVTLQEMTEQDDSLLLPDEVKPRAFTLSLSLSYATNGLVSIVFVAFVAMAVPQIGYVLHTSNSTAGYIMTVIGVMYAITAATNPFLMRVLSDRAALVVALTASLAGSALMASWGNRNADGPSLARVICACLLTPIGYSLANSVLMKRVGQECKGHPATQSRAFKILSTVMALSRCAATLWTGVMLNWGPADGEGLYYGSMVLCLIIFILCAVMPRSPSSQH